MVARHTLTRVLHFCFTRHWSKIYFYVFGTFPQYQPLFRFFFIFILCNVDLTFTSKYNLFLSLFVLFRKFSRVACDMNVINTLRLTFQKEKREKRFQKKLWSVFFFICFANGNWKWNLVKWKRTKTGIVRFVIPIYLKKILPKDFRLELKYISSVSIFRKLFFFNMSALLDPPCYIFAKIISNSKSPKNLV